MHDVIHYVIVTVHLKCHWAAVTHLNLNALIYSGVGLDWMNHVMNWAVLVIVFVFLMAQTLYSELIWLFLLHNMIVSVTDVLSFFMQWS